MKITARQVGEIVEKAKGQHYQLACGMTFEVGLNNLNAVDTL